MFLKNFDESKSEAKNIIKAQELKARIMAAKGARQVYKIIIFIILTTYAFAFSSLNVLDIVFSEPSFNLLNGNKFIFNITILVISSIFLLWSLSENFWIRSLKIDKGINDLLNEKKRHH
ncbi:MAG: hypothetical protein KDD58_14855 [Bdellovibrionales bacterium]|nr:hypothetical protein [Bdellovibrionales bacterium]